MEISKFLSPEKKQLVLNFIKNIVPKRTYKAVSILLSPCCSNSILSTEFTCDPDNSGNYVATLKFAQPITFIGNASVLIYIDNGIATEGDNNGSPYFPLVAGNSTQVFSNIFTNLVSPAGAKAIKITTQFPVLDNGTNISNLLDGGTATLPSCP